MFSSWVVSSLVDWYMWFSCLLVVMRAAIRNSRIAGGLDFVDVDADIESWLSVDVEDLDLFDGSGVDAVEDIVPIKTGSCRLFNPLFTAIVNGPLNRKSELEGFFDELSVVG